MNCEEVWRHISDYIDEDLDTVQRAALDDHFAGCLNCTAVVDGTRNVIALYRDQRVLALPAGFHERLHQKLDKEMKRSRRVFLRWTLIAAAAVSFAFSALSVRKFVLPGHDARSAVGGGDARRVPDTVAVSEDHDDRVYHSAGCTHLLARLRPSQ